MGWHRRWVEQKDGRRRLPGVSGVREFGSLTRVDLAFVCPCMSLEFRCFERDIIGRGPTSGGPTGKYLINLLLVFGQGLRGKGDWLYLLWLGYRKRGCIGGVWLDWLSLGWSSDCFWVIWEVRLGKWFEIPHSRSLVVDISLRIVAILVWESHHHSNSFPAEDRRI